MPRPLALWKNARERQLAPRDRIAPIGIRGHGLIELRNAETGRVELAVPFENYVSLDGIKRLQWMTRHAVSMNGGTDTDEFEVGAGGTGYPRFWDLAADDSWEGEPADLFTHLVLNADTAAEVTTRPRMDAENFVTVAWANKDGYAGADTKRGSPNFGEMRRDAARTLWVFDWPTSAGNGTFRSVWWTRLDETSLLPRCDLASTPTVSWTEAGRGSGRHGVWDAGDGSHFWAGDPLNTTGGDPTICRRAYSDGAVDSGSEITRTTVGHRVAGLAYDGVSDTLWAEEYYVDGETISNISPAGSVLSTVEIPSPLAGNHNGLAFAQNRLYVQALIGTDLRVAELNPSTGAVLAYTDVPSSGSLASFGGMSYDPTSETLFACDGTTDGIWEFDLELEIVGHHYSSTAMTRKAPVFRSGSSAYAEGLMAWVDGPVVAGGTGAVIYTTKPGAYGTRTLLGTDVVKSSLQTMKVTYQFDFDYG